MERLRKTQVYDQFHRTMPMLRAARNRIRNTFITTHYDKVVGTRCLEIAEQLHDEHVQRGVKVLHAANMGLESGDAQKATQGMNALHRYNRLTARLTRLFESDVSDELPIIEDAYKKVNGVEVRVPGESVRVPVKIRMTKFMSRLQEAHAAIAAHGSRAKFRIKADDTVAV